MKHSGITRPLDRLGRIVIPKEIRKNLGLKQGDEMDIFTANGGLVVIRKAVGGCFHCGATTDLRKFKTIQVCGSCAKAISKLPAGE